MPDPVSAMAGGQIVSGLMGASAARSAARTQAAAADRAMQNEREMYDISREDLAPYRGMGYGAVRDIERLQPFFTQRFNQPYQYGGQPTQALKTGTGAAPSLSAGTMPANYQEARSAFDQQQQANSNPRLLDQIGLAVTGKDQFGQEFGYRSDADAFNQFYNQNYGTPAPASAMAADGAGAPMMPISGPGSPFEEYLDPSMAFRQKLGTQATERMANVGGGALSGNTLRALTDYGQGLASTEYGNAFNRFQTERGNIYNTLANIAGMGQGAVNTGVNAGQNFAGQTTGLLTGQAAAQAGGQVGAANAIGGAAQNVGNMAYLQSLMNPAAANPAVAPASGYGMQPSPAANPYQQFSYGSNA
jgi:hypothetical protein